MAGNKKYTKEILIELYNDLKLRLKKQPSKRDWEADNLTPSIMPVRCAFKSWGEFVVECGDKPQRATISRLAREKCILSRRGKRSGNYKEGKYIDKNGYVNIYYPEHPNSKGSGYVLEHRLVMSNHLKRELIKGENIHHKDGDRSNNNVSNLELWDSTQPSGQRVKDKIKWAINFLQRHDIEITGNIHDKN